MTATMIFKEKAHVKKAFNLKTPDLSSTPMSLVFPILRANPIAIGEEGNRPQRD